MRIVVPGTFPGMNEIIKLAKMQHRGAYAEQKREYTGRVALVARARNLPTVQRAVVRLHWYCDSMRRDPDNIMAAAKFVLDGLVSAGVLPNDGWRNVAGIHHRFELDRGNPRVEIEVEEVGVA